MPINEATRPRRERWPVEFDIEGVPRDTATRQRLLAERRALETSPLEESETMQGTRLVRNQFAVDQNEVIVDINNPPHKNYNPHDPKNEYPKMLYPANPLAKPVIAGSKEQEAELLKKKFTLKPPVAKQVEE